MSNEVQVPQLNVEWIFSSPYSPNNDFSFSDSSKSLHNLECRIYWSQRFREDNCIWSLAQCYLCRSFIQFCGVNVKGVSYYNTSLNIMIHSFPVYSKNLKALCMLEILPKYSGQVDHWITLVFFFLRSHHQQFYRCDNKQIFKEVIHLVYGYDQFKFNLHE